MDLPDGRRMGHAHDVAPGCSRRAPWFVTANSTAFVLHFGYECCMAGSTIAKLGPIAAEHWGMITTTQASQADVSRKTLSALTASGALERLAQGVYRMAGAPAAMLEIDTVRVRWLALGGAASVVAAGKSAAALHSIGDWFAGASEFVAPTRRTTRIDGVRIRIRSRARRSWRGSAARRQGRPYV